MICFGIIKHTNHRHACKGQAAVELTVFGFLIVVALSVLTMYGQQFEMQQQAKMEAFRRAIKLAYDKNASVAFTIKKDTRFIDIMGAYGKGQATSVAGSANVMWQKGMAGSDSKGKDSSFSYYAVNDEMIGVADPKHPGVYPNMLPTFSKRVVGFDSSERDIDVPVGVWKEEIARKETYHGEMTKKEEKPGNITNTRIGELKDQLSTKVITRQDNAVDNDPWRDRSAFGPAPNYSTGATYSVNQGATLLMDRGSKPDQGQSKYEDMPLNGGDPNRVVYTKEAALANAGSGTTISRTRKWVTDIVSE